MLESWLHCVLKNMFYVNFIGKRTENMQHKFLEFEDMIC